MSTPYEVITIFSDGTEDTWPCSSLDAANLRIERHKPDAVFIQLRESKWKILSEWRRSQEQQAAASQAMQTQDESDPRI